MQSFNRSLISAVRLFFNPRVIVVVLIYALFTTQTVALGATPPSVSSILPLPKPNGSLLEKAGEEALEYFLGKQIDKTLPLRLNGDDKLPTVSNAELPGGPFHGKELVVTAQNASQELTEGDYKIRHVLSFCTQYSVHRAGRNAATVLAPVSGSQARTISKLLWNGTQAARTPQSLQDTSWAIQNGATFQQLSKPEQDDVMTFAPDARAGLEQGFDIDKPVRMLYDDIVANPRPYLIQWKHEHQEDNLLKYVPDALIPNFKLNAPPLNVLIGRLGPIGKVYVQALADRNAYQRDMDAKAHKQEIPYVQTDQPMPPSEGPWSVRVPGRAYMGSLQETDHIVR